MRHMLVSSVNTILNTCIEDLGTRAVILITAYVLLMPLGKVLFSLRTLIHFYQLSLKILPRRSL